MIAASQPVQRPPQARLLAVDDHGLLAHSPRSAFVDFLRPGDMDTPLHALAVPDADPMSLQKPETAAHELLDQVAQLLAVTEKVLP